MIQLLLGSVSSAGILLGGGAGPGPSVDTFSTFDGDPEFVSISPVVGYGMVKRNSAYTGPALEVEDAGNPGTTVDVGFDDSGKVSGARPFGVNTRVIRLYDQWGSEDLTANYTDGIGIVEDNIGGGYYTWRLDFSSASTGLVSATKAARTPSWELANPLWVVGHERLTNTGLPTIFNVNSNSSWMIYGLWQEANDLHWRVDQSNASDWTGTDWVADAAAAQAFAVALGDVTQRNGSAYAYFNGADAGSRTFANPLDTYDADSLMQLGDTTGIGDPFTGYVTELHVFSSTNPASTAEIARVYEVIEETKNGPPAAGSGGGTGGDNPPVLEDYTKSEASNNATTITFTAPTGITAGDFLALLVTTGSTTGGDDWTTPAGWTKEFFYGDATSDSTICLMWKIADGSETDITFTGLSSINQHAGWYMRFSGVDESTPIDVEGSVQIAGSGTSIAAPSVVTNTGNALVVAVMAVDQYDSYPVSLSGSSSGEFTFGDTCHGGTTSTGSSAGFATRVVNPAGASGTATFAHARDDGMIAMQFALKPVVA